MGGNMSVNVIPSRHTRGGEHSEHASAISPMDVDEDEQMFRCLTAESDEVWPLETIKEECPVCLKPIRHVATLDACSHKFCLPCIVRWMKESNSCPCCRARFSLIKHTVINGCGVSMRKEISAEHRDFHITDDSYWLPFLQAAAGFGEDDEDDVGDGSGHDETNPQSFLQVLMRFHLILSMFDEMEELVDEQHPEISQLPRVIVLPGMFAFQIGPSSPLNRRRTNETMNENSVGSSERQEEGMERESLHPPTPVHTNPARHGESSSESDVRRPQVRIATYRMVGLPPMGQQTQEQLFDETTTIADGATLDQEMDSNLADSTHDEEHATSSRTDEGMEDGRTQMRESRKS
eukprot:TRINITY_DN448_c0_g1_i2.p1 TRINITY_DN448_c0_g1~~TRINITY_DN448_c0_g1_i2.p1  ORF type:complete len:349 (-),score=85.70 TRINITY_DN448_c0_g1_i2:157-1203(-)